MRLRLAQMALLAVLASALAVGLVGPAGATRADTSLDGTWRGEHFQKDSAWALVEFRGSFEVGWTIRAARRFPVGSCTFPAGTLLNRVIAWHEEHGLPISPTGQNVYIVQTAVFDQSPCSVKMPPPLARPKEGCPHGDPYCTYWDLSILGPGKLGGKYLGNVEWTRVGPLPGTTKPTPPTTTPKPPPTTTTPTTTTPKPPPTTTPPAASLQVDLFEFPDRYGRDVDPKDGLVDAFDTPARVNPSTWTALVWVHRGEAECDPTASYSFWVDGRPAVMTPTAKKCVFEYPRYRSLGKHTVEVHAKLANGTLKKGSGKILLRDYLIVGLGDSVGSGEGNPESGSWGLGATWQERRCDRSHHSYQAWVAGWLKDTSDRTSVTFVHLACSGATIAKGLVHGYAGINPVRGRPLPAQVDELGRLLKATGRTPDAVLLSIGANDLGFGQIVQFCLYNGYCPNRTGFDKDAPKLTLDQVVKLRLHELPGRYATLARRLEAIGVPADRVFITEYFDPTRNQFGKYCDPMVRLSRAVRLLGPIMITKEEAQFAYEDVLSKLNEQVAAAAVANHWNPAVTGIARSFWRHGYCSSATWIVQLTESLVKQYAVAGALHPNQEGHKAIALNVIRELKAHKPPVDGQLDH